MPAKGIPWLYGGWIACGRSLKHLIEVVEDLESRKVGFIRLQEGINTTTSEGRLVFHLFGALAEFERILIRERTQAGLSAAGARAGWGAQAEAEADPCKNAPQDVRQQV